MPAATTLLEFHERVSDCGYAPRQTEIALAYAEQRLETLQARYEAAALSETYVEDDDDPRCG